MECSMAKLETSRVRLEVSTLASKLECEQKQIDLLKQEKSNIHQELNAKIVKLEEVQQNYLQSVKDQARPLSQDPISLQLREHNAQLSEQNKTLQRELILLKDQCLIQQTKLSDAHMMLGAMRTQLEKEQHHREEL